MSRAGRWNLSERRRLAGESRPGKRRLSEPRLFGAWPNPDSCPMLHTQRGALLSAPNRRSPSEFKRSNAQSSRTRAPSLS